MKDGMEVAMKIQYPGVADSIESDIENVKLLLNYTNLIPKGLFLDSAIKVSPMFVAVVSSFLISEKKYNLLIGHIKVPNNLKPTHGGFKLIQGK